MRKELRFERHFTPVRMLKQIKDIRKEIIMLKKEQGHIIEILEETELTPEAKKALKEARTTPVEKYISHDEIR